MPTYRESKRLTHMKIIQLALLMPKVTLEIMQKVDGVINTLVMMCPLLRFLRAPIIAQHLLNFKFVVAFF